MFGLNMLCGTWFRESALTGRVFSFTRTPPLPASFEFCGCTFSSIFFLTSFPDFLLFLKETFPSYLDLNAQPPSSVRGKRKRSTALAGLITLDTMGEAVVLLKWSQPYNK